MSIPRPILASLFALSLLLPSILHATPSNKAALERHFDRFLAKKLRACSTCHLPSNHKNPESLEEFPHNPFGQRLRLLGDDLKSAGKPKDIPTRLSAISSEDSDNDGIDNLTELLLSHSPGDPSDKPTADALQLAPQKRSDFTSYLTGHRWRPFDSVQRPPIPPLQTTKDKPQTANPIDSFVSAEHQSRNLSFRPEAPKNILLRRLYLDLIGLTPTPEELDAYENDNSPNSYEKVVDKLLADPRHGERWGRHWMDVWRYSDWAGWTDGGQIRDSQPHIWQWRDWIVESLNADKPYDQMVIEMLAADELYPDDPKTLRATGFLARNYKMLSREQWMEDTINHTSRALLGITMHCAKCHDHMYDPVSQAEYYSFRAIFEPHKVRLDRLPGQTDPKALSLPRVYDHDLDAPTFFFIRGDERRPDKDRKLDPGVPKVLGGEYKVTPVSLPYASAHPDRREFVRADLLAASEKSLAAAKEALETAKKDAKDSTKQSAAESALTVAEAKHAALIAQLAVERFEDEFEQALMKASPTTKPAKEAWKSTEQWRNLARAAAAAQRQANLYEAVHNALLARNVHAAAAKALESTKKEDKPAHDKAAAAVADAKKKLDAAEKTVVNAAESITLPANTGYKRRPTDDFPDRSTGRRTALARWIANKQNPLTARVAVNHIWLRHFGTGIVPSPDDFGFSGRPPTHPALLDYLAAELMDHRWSMKHLHRLIVTSATYKQSSQFSLIESASADATLNPEPRTLNPTSIDPDNTYLWRTSSRRMEAEVVRDNLLHISGQLDPTFGGPEIDHHQALVSKRRSIYIRIAPEKEAEFLKIFDGPNPTECYERKQSVIPQQSLALLNSELILTRARELAHKLHPAYKDDDAFITRLYLQTLTRRPTPEELTHCRDFLSSQSKRLSATTQPSTPDPALRARENLTIVLFNHHDFLTIR